MLNEVYGPLYLYLTTQEAAREIFANFKDEFRKVYNKDDIPIFELGKNMCEDGLNETLFKPDDFFEITKKADRALMSPSLVNLIGAYQSIEYLYDEKDSSKKLYFDEKRRVIQKKIVNEVLRGYQECTKRIGMHETSSIINIYKYSIDKLE